MNNKKFKLISLCLLLFSFWNNLALAATCRPAWDWNWTVTSTCDYPAWWYKVYWNTYVWDYTVSLWAWINMWTDLSVNKITFNNWKILLSTSSKIDNASWNRYYIAVYYWWWLTSCPSWMSVFNINNSVAPVYNASSFNNSNAYNNWSPIRAPPTWTMFCGTRGT